MKSYVLKFTVPASDAVISSGGEKSIEIKTGDRLSISLYYSFRDNPLVLTADATAGDEAKLLLTDAHIVLYIGGKLCDEEWCCGELSIDSLDGGGFIFTLEESCEKFELPIRKDLSAEGLRLEGVNIGDCMPFSDPENDGAYHLFWLYDRHHHCSKWGLGAHQWAHASTKDLIHWDEHPMAVAITEQYEGSICTGSAIRDGDSFYAWYAIRMSDGSPARLTSAVSEDGDNYVKTGKFFTLPERYHRSSARDPKIVKYDGKYHMMVTTTLLATGNGCLAHLVSEHADMSSFTDLGPIIEWGSGDQPECPDYFIMNEYHYLVWSIGGRARYAFSRSPFGEGGWTVPEDNQLVCGNVPKSAVCPWNGERVFMGFVGENGYGGHLIMKRTIFHEDGRIELAEI